MSRVTVGANRASESESRYPADAVRSMTPIVFDFCGEEILKQQDDVVARKFRVAETADEPMTDGRSEHWLSARLSSLGFAGIELFRPQSLEDLRVMSERNAFRIMPECLIAGGISS